MTRLRAFLIALTVLAMAVAPMLVARTIGVESAPSPPAYAAVAAAPMQQDDDGDNDDDDDTDGDNDEDDTDGDNDEDDDGDNDDEDDDGDNDEDDDDNDEDGDDDDDGDDNDNDGDDGAVDPPAAAAPAAAAPVSGCTTPGQEMGFQSADVRVIVQVFGSMSQSIRLSIPLPIDQAAVPPATGQVVGDLYFQVIAYTCSDNTPIAVLPAEVNLAVNYADADVGGLDEGRLVLARLDTSTNQWRTVEKQATDPPNNYTSATITEMGYYVLYQRP